MIESPTHTAVIGQDGLYVYCVARGDRHHVFGPIGLDDQVVYTLGSGNLRAIVHPCCPEPYQSHDAHAVEKWVVTHQAVVRAATEAFGTVLPMAFDMIVSGREGQGAVEALNHWLDERRERFTGLLAKLAGKAEYGVQVFWDRLAVAAMLTHRDPKLRQMQEELRGKPKGMAHVLGQGLAKAVRAAMEKHADQLALDFYDRIRRCVDDVRVDKLKKTDGERQMLLNLSCLMSECGTDLGRVLDEIQASPGISVRFTGPWPPYSFVGG